MFDVAIVGFGPVGSALAILLAQKGHSVVVFEKRPTPYARPRAVHFDHEVGRILQACGIGDGLATIVEPTEVYEWRNAAGTTLLRFGSRGIGLSGWPASNMMHQPDLENLLKTRVHELPNVTLRRGVDVTGLAQDADGVTVAYTEADVAAETQRARFVIGCDGAPGARGVLGG